MVRQPTPAVAPRRRHGMPFAIAATLLLRLAASAAGIALSLDLAERARASGVMTATTEAHEGP
jgi:hypothetical protein